MKLQTCIAIVGVEEITFLQVQSIWQLLVPNKKLLIQMNVRNDPYNQGPCCSDQQYFHILLFPFTALLIFLQVLPKLVYIPHNCSLTVPERSLMRMMDRDYLHSTLCEHSAARTGPGFSVLFCFKNYCIIATKFLLLFCEF